MHLPLPVCGVKRMEKEASVIIAIGWNLSRKGAISLNRNPEAPLKEGNVCQLWVLEAKVTIFVKVISLDDSYSPTKIADSHVILNP